MSPLFGAFQHNQLAQLSHRLTISQSDSQIIVEKVTRIFQPCQDNGYACQNVIGADHLHTRGINTCSTFLIPIVMTPPNFTPESTDATKFFTDFLSLLTPQVSSITASQNLLHVQLNQESISYLLKPLILYQEDYLLPQLSTKTLYRGNPFKWQDRFTAVSQHQKHFFDALKLIKFWNQTKNQQALRDDHLEAILIHLLDSSEQEIREHLSIVELCERFFKYCSRYYYTCPDPSGLEEPLTDYLSDALQYWYVLMNRIKESQDAIASSGQDFYTFLISPTEAS